MAAVRGTIDFREADVLDVGWWRRVRLLLDGLSQECDRELLTALYTYDLALVANSGLSEDSFKDVQKSAKESFEKIHNAYRPWKAHDEAAVRLSESQQHKEAYKALIGDLDDPEFVREKKLARIKRDAKQEIKEKEEAAKKALTTEEFVAQRRAETDRMLAEVMQKRAEES